MSTIPVFRQSTARPEPLPLAIPIHEGAAPERPAAAPAVHGYGAVPGGSPSQGGRAPFPRPAERVALKPLWRRTFDPGFGIRGLAVARDRLYLDAQLRWSLLDAATGMSRAGGLRGLGTAALDATNGLVYQPDADGRLQGLHVDRGQAAFWAALFLGDQYARRFVAPVGERLILLGFERPLPEPEEPPPETTLLEALVVGPVPPVRPSGQLEPSPVLPLIFEAVQPRAAAWSAGLVLAFPDALFLLDGELNVTAHLTGSFTPVALSVDEEGWPHLLVDEPDSGRALWIVSPEGLRTLRFPLPAPFQAATAPPAITGARDVVIRGERALLCVTAAGAIRWSRPTGAMAFPVATSDGNVLVADGSELVAFAPDGQRDVVHRFDPADDLGGQPLATAPLLEEGGVITVASESRVVRLAPARK